MLSPEQLLAEIEDLIRTTPSRNDLRKDIQDNYSWFGRAAALIAEWKPLKEIVFHGYIREIHSLAGMMDPGSALSSILTMLHQARHELRLSTVGPLSLAVEKGAVFDYFDEVRKVIEGASSDLFFVDPYLDAEFVSRYLPHVRSGVSVRLLGQNCLSTLLPAVELFRRQHQVPTDTRVSNSLHDRFLFVDKSACYQSGASFKDGAKKAPTMLTQITDAFVSLQSTYESLWGSAIPQGKQ